MLSFPSPLHGEGDHREYRGARDCLGDDRLQVAGHLAEGPRVLVPHGVDLDRHRHKKGQDVGDGQVRQVDVSL